MGFDDQRPRFHHGSPGTCTKIRKPPPLVWFPPDFDNADSYCYQACIDGTQVIDFGCFNNETIKATMEGSVVCWGEDISTGDGIMTIEVGSGRKVKRMDIKVVVLGSVVFTGTAILLDSSGHVWFYNVPGAVDPYLERMVDQVDRVPKDRDDEVYGNSVD